MNPRSLQTWKKLHQYGHTYNEIPDFQSALLVIGVMFLTRKPEVLLNVKDF